MSEEWTTQLKPGDEVAVLYGYARDVRIKSVERVTPTGRVSVRWGSSILEFNPDGRQRGRSSGFSSYYRITLATDALREQAELQGLRERLGMVEWKELDLATLRRVAAALSTEEPRNG